MLLALSFVAGVFPQIAGVGAPRVPQDGSKEARRLFVMYVGVLAIPLDRVDAPEASPAVIFCRLRCGNSGSAHLEGSANPGGTGGRIGIVVRPRSRIIEDASLSKGAAPASSPIIRK